MSNRWQRIVIRVCIGTISLALASCGTVTTKNQIGYSSIPKIPTTEITSQGIYPQVINSTFNPAQANKMIRASVVAAENQFLHLEVPIRADDPSNKPGYYAIFVDPGLISAGPKLVSGLLPVSWELPTGTGVNDWITFAASLPDGASVRLVNRIFSDKPLALKRLSELSIIRLKAEHSCFGESSFNYVTHPSSDNYSRLALTAQGLAIGFVGAGSCHYAEVTIPYNLIRSLFNPYGSDLVLNARRPNFFRLPKQSVWKGPYLGG